MALQLNVFVAEKKRKIFEELRRGEFPSEGEYSQETVIAGREKGDVQMGTTRYDPDFLILEFTYADPLGASLILSVKIVPPERIVFMPVPDWVIETIWQGEVSGRFTFESEAQAYLSHLELQLTPQPNRILFAPPGPKRKD
jgi:hypothetical protein